MSAREDRAGRHVLIVTGSERDRLYERFAALFAGRGDVEVVKDRRVAQRRRAALGPGDGERRATDRRRVRPDWVVPPV
jgi:hypothetical protein